MSQPKLRHGLRAAIVATGLVGAVSLSGCTKLRDRIVDGTSFDGEQCVGWSLQGSPESCCSAQGGVLYTGSSGISCVTVVEGPFVPPSMDV